MNRTGEVKEFLPLSPAALHILLALAGEDLHGYGIMLGVVQQSNDQYKLGPGTLTSRRRRYYPSEQENNPHPWKLFLVTYGATMYRLFEMLVACDVLRSAH